MKLRGVEGTPQEIKDLLVVHGLQLTDYLDKPNAPLGKIWLLIPAFLLVLALALFLFLADPSGTFVKLLFLLGAGAVLWLCISIQIRFENAWATGVAAVGGLLLILVAAGFIAPKETLDAIKSLQEK